MTHVSAHAVGARLRSRTGLAALVVALVVGILGMHALTSHGTPAAAVPAPGAAASTMTMTGMTAIHDATTWRESYEGHAHAAAASHPSPRAAATSGDAGSGHDMASMVMLCVVMLAAAALTLLVVLAAGALRQLLPAAFAPAVVRERALQWVRGTGPPPAWQFSVIRC